MSCLIWIYTVYVLFFEFSILNSLDNTFDIILFSGWRSVAANSSPVGSSLQPHSSSIDAFTPRSDRDAPRSAFLTMNPRATTLPGRDQCSWIIQGFVSHSTLHNSVFCCFLSFEV